MIIEIFWEILNGPIGRIIGSGGLIAVSLYSIYTLVTIPAKKESNPSESVGKTNQFNSRRNCIIALCWVNFPLCIGGISLYYIIIQNYINENSSGVITIESTGTILIILMVILAILSFISSLIIRNKVSRLK